MSPSTLVIWNGHSASGKNKEVASSIVQRFPEAVAIGFYEVLANPDLLLKNSYAKVVGIGGDGTHGTIAAWCRQIGVPYVAMNRGTVGLFPQVLGTVERPFETPEKYQQRMLNGGRVLEINPGIVTFDEYDEEHTFMGLAGVGLFSMLLEDVELKRRRILSRWRRLLSVTKQALMKTIYEAPRLEVVYPDGSLSMASEVVTIKHEFSALPVLTVPTAPAMDAVLTLPEGRERKAIPATVARVVFDYICLELGLEPRFRGITLRYLQKGEEITIFAPTLQPHLDTELKRSVKKMRIQPYSQLPPYRVVSFR